MAIQTLTTKRQVLDAPLGYTVDGRVPGFMLCVRRSTKAGETKLRRTWLLDYRLTSGHRRRMVLGSAAALAPQDAYQLALKHHAAIANGRDPLGDKADARKAEAAAVTLTKFFERYVSDYATGKKKPRSLADDVRMFRHDIQDALGRIRVPDLTREDIEQFHRRVGKQTPILANRLLALLSKMMNLAEKWGIRADGSNPCRHVTRYKEHKTHRFLSSAQLLALGATLAAVEKTPKDGAGYELPSVVAAVRLLLFTGMRRGEVLGLTWNDVNLDAGVLDLPDSKTGRKVIVLNAPARALLDTLAKQRRHGVPWVLTGRYPDRPLVGLPHAWLRIRTRAGLDGVRLNDLRHSYASTAAGLGASLPIIGSLLGHTVAQTTARYAGIANDPRREAAERVGERLNALLNPPAQPATVTALGGRRKKAARRG